jgi:hypothetical protein
MKITIDVPQTFDISINQVKQFLMDGGWIKQSHTDNLDKYQCPKHSNVYVMLPKHEGNLLDEEYVLYSALRLIANVNNNCGIETVIDRILKGK